MLLSQADRSIAQLDGVGTVLPNPELFIAMYVKKEAKMYRKTFLYFIVVVVTCLLVQVNQLHAQHDTTQISIENDFAIIGSMFCRICILNNRTIVDKRCLFLNID